MNKIEISTAGYTALGLPHDGESFRDETPGECADRLMELRELGYRVPQYAIDLLREEEEDGAPTGGGDRS